MIVLLPIAALLQGNGTVRWPEGELCPPPPRVIEIRWIVVFKYNYLLQYHNYNRIIQKKQALK